MEDCFWVEGIVSGEKALVGTVAVGLRNSGKVFEQWTDFPGSAAFSKMEVNALTRIEDNPQPGIAGFARSLQIEQLDRSLVHLDVAA